MISFIKKLYNKVLTLMGYRRKVLQVEVPMACESEADKQDVIFATLNFLERNIKIEDYE